MQEEIVKRVISWSKGNKQGSTHIQFNPTDRCNLKCIFCWQRDTSRVSYENEISDKRYMELIDEAHQLNVKKITLTGGGEPFCRPNSCLEIMEKIKEYNIEGSLITNGTLFNENNIKKIVQIRWDEVIISLDSPKEEIHDYLRQSKGSYNKITKSIKLFNKYKKDLPKLCIHFVLCNKNYKQIPKLIELANKLDIRNVFIEPIVTVTITTNIAEGLKLDEKQKKELPKYVKRALKLCNKYHIENNLNPLLEPNLIEKVNKMKELILTNKRGKKNDLLSIPCYEPWYNMIIRPNGRVGPCCMFDFSGEYCHNKSLKEIWFGNYFNKIRKSMLQNRLPSYCSNCNPSQIVNNISIRNKLEKSL